MEVLGTSEVVYLLSGGNTNTLALVDEKSVTVIDPNRPGWGRPILDAISLVTDLPVSTIINTHPHEEQIGANSEFPTATQIIAHENAKARMATMNIFQGANARFLPNRTYKEKMSLFEGANRIDLYHFGPAHTDGDTIVVFPAKRMAYMSDLFASKAAPVIDTRNGGSGVAYPVTLAKAVEALAGLNLTRVFGGGLQASNDYSVNAKENLPGAIGRFFTWRDFQEYADFNRDFLAGVKDAIAAGKTVDEAAATLSLPDRYKGYGMEHATANVHAIYAELKK
jgi:glyoxylase-like metal-dependent hydrolase (beta-lactamase superfamily II)